MVRAVCLAAFAVIGPINIQAQEYAITEIGTLGGDKSVAFGLNDLGKVVGWAHKTHYYYERPYIWSAGTMLELSPTLYYTNEAWATGISNSTHLYIPHICGGRPPSWSQAFMWHGYVEHTVLDAFPGNTRTWATDINDAGDIVGYATTITGKQRAVLWTTDGIHDLSLPLDPLKGCFKTHEFTDETNAKDSMEAILWHSHLFPIVCGKRSIRCCRPRRPSPRGVAHVCPTGPA